VTSNVDRRSELARTAGRNPFIWEVFARTAYEEPLHHVGTITEPDEDLALVSARAVYDEQPWIQMIIVPRAAIREAISA
jgi:1,2-phenylacetyl-CoA epoxidase PaaB subunit